MGSTLNAWIWLDLCASGDISTCKLSKQGLPQRVFHVLQLAVICMEAWMSFNEKDWWLYDVVSHSEEWYKQYMFNAINIWKRFWLYKKSGFLPWKNNKKDLQ